MIPLPRFLQQWHWLELMKCGIKSGRRSLTVFVSCLVYAKQRHFNHFKVASIPNISIFLEVIYIEKYSHHAKNTSIMLISFPICIHGKCFQLLDEFHNLFVTCWLLLIQHRVFNHEYILFTDIQRKHVTKKFYLQWTFAGRFHGETLEWKKYLNEQDAQKTIV